MSNSSLVDYVRISPHSTNPRNDKIRKITIHHMAGNLCVENCGEVFQNRAASANYGIGSDGRVGLYVDERNRSWASDSRANDHQAVTIEVANSEIGGDWPVSDRAYRKLIDLCVDICRRNGIERLTYTGDGRGNLTMHQFFAATACPGPYLKARFPQIAAEVNRRLNEQEDDEMLSYAQFKEYMAQYEAEQDGKAEPNWSVKEGHWGKAVNEGIINSGAPEGLVKRDEMVAVLGRLGLLDVRKTVTDISETGDGHSKWADAAVEALTAAGIFRGDGNGNYGWGQCITREAAAKVLYELMVRAGLV